MARKYSTAKPALDAMNEIQIYIRRRLGKEQLRINPIDLMRELQHNFKEADRRCFKAAIDAMVTGGELIYSHHFNTSQLEMNSSGIVEVSERLVINAHADHKLDQGGPASGRVQIAVQDGSAFGRGDHPTTILALKALDEIAAKVSAATGGQAGAMLDIGTGTGILAIAAVKLGFAKAVGLDIDPQACHEAAQNVRLNRLIGRISIVAGDLQALKPSRFDLIAANLRPPTLARLMPTMAARTAWNGCWILSGFRPEEMAALQKELPQGFQSIWSQSNRNWAAFAVQRIVP